MASARVRVPSIAAGQWSEMARHALRASAEGVLGFFQKDTLTFAASIAYYALLSFFPFLLLVLSGLSHVAIVHDDSGLLRILAVGLPGHFDFVVTQFEELARAPLQFTALGTIVTLWASMGVFSAITSAVNHAWGLRQQRGFLMGRLTALIMLAAAGVLLLATLALMAAFQVIYAGRLHALISSYPWIGWLGGSMARIAPTPLFIVVVGLIYYFVPYGKVRLRDVWVGAVLAGLLWRGAFAVFSWYVSDFKRFSVHGSIAAVVAFLVWVYVSSVILLYGVQVSAVYARLRRVTRAARDIPAPL